jgi:hypothetical protein
MGKTKAMRCMNGLDQEDNTGKFPCRICKKGVRANSNQCMLVTHGYIRNAAVLKGDCKVYLVIDVEGVWMVSRTSQKC